MFRLYSAAFALVAAGGVAIVSQYHKAVDYTSVQGRITSVQTQCFLEKKAWRKSYTSDDMECSVARFAQTNQRGWMGYDLKTKITVKFTYVSPVDGKQHTGQDYLGAPPAKPLNTGDAYPVRASKTIADQTI